MDFQKGKGSHSKLEESNDTSSSPSFNTPEVVVLNRFFNNPSFDRRGSLVSQQQRSSEVFSMEEMALSSHGSVKSRVSKISRDSKCRASSNDSFEKISEKLSLKKTDETINFSFENVNRDRMDDNDIQCAAERLRLGDERKSSSEVTARSDTFFSDNLLDELNIDSQEDEFVSYDKISQSYIPFQTCESANRGSNELVSQTKEEDKVQNFWGLNRSQIVAFFGRTKMKKKKKPNFGKMDFFRIRLLDRPAPPEDDIKTKEFMRSFHFYIVQLIIITGVAMSMVSSDMFFFSDITRSLFFDSVYTPEYANDTDEFDENSYSPYSKTLKGSKTIDDFWNYAENTMVNLLYWEFYDPQYYLNRRILESDPHMFNENHILGVPRIRQVRVKKNSCTMHSKVQKFFDACYDHYSVFSEDTKPIKKGMENTSTATAWRYTDSSKLKSFYYWGEMGVYGGGGYYLDLGKDKQKAKAMLEELKKNDWISRATRAVFVSFNLYNANVNLFCLCQLILEFPPVGGMIPNADCRTFKFIRYLHIFDYFVLGIEYVYMLFVAYNSWEIYKLISQQRVAFLFNAWNYLDLFIVFTSYAYIILGIIRFIRVSRFLDSIPEDDSKHVDVAMVKFLQIAYNYTIALLVFATWIKLYTFLTFTETMIQIRKSLTRSFKELFWFIPMFLTIFTAFAYVAYLLFGDRVLSYSTISRSFQSLLQGFFGGFDYSVILETNVVLGPIFYVAFVVFIFFVFVNVFSAIVIYGYIVIKSQVIQDTNRTGDYFRRGIVNLFTCCRPVKKRKNLTKATRKKILFSEIESALKRAGFKGEEIRIFFHKYNINCSNFLEDKTKTRIMKDLELKHIDFSQTSEQLQINFLRRRLEECLERLDNWELKLQPVIDKVDVLIKRL